MSTPPISPRRFKDLGGASNNSPLNSHDKFSEVLGQQRLRFSNMIGKSRKFKPLKKGGGASGGRVPGKYAAMEDDPRDTTVMENFNDDHAYGDHDDPNNMMVTQTTSLDAAVAPGGNSPKKISTRFKKIMSKRQERKQLSTASEKGLGRFRGRFGNTSNHGGNTRFGMNHSHHNASTRSTGISQSPSYDAWDMSDEDEVVEGDKAQLSPKENKISSPAASTPTAGGASRVIRPSESDDDSSNYDDDDSKSISSNSSSSVASSDLEILNNSKDMTLSIPEPEKVDMEADLEDLRNEIEKVQSISREEDDLDIHDDDHDDDDSQSHTEETEDSLPKSTKEIIGALPPNSEGQDQNEDDEEQVQTEIKNGKDNGGVEGETVLQLQKGVVFGEVAKRINCVCGRGEDCYDVSATFFDADDPRSGYTLLPTGTSDTSPERHRRELFLNHLLPKKDDKDSFDDDLTVDRYIANHHFHPKMISQSSRGMVCKLPVRVERQSMFRLQMGLTADEKVMDEDGIPTGEYYLCPNYDFQKAIADSLRMTRVKRAVEANCKVSADKLVVEASDGDTGTQQMLSGNTDEVSTPPRETAAKLTLANNVGKEKDGAMNRATAILGLDGEMALPKYEVTEESRLQLYTQLLQVENKRRKKYGPKLFNYSNDWNFARDVLVDGLKELVQAEKFIAQLAKAQKNYADSMRAVYEDVFLDDVGNVAGSWKHGMLSNRRMNQDYTQILEGTHDSSPTRSPKSSVHGASNRNQRPEERTGMLCPLIDTTSILSEEFGDCAIHAQQTASNDVTAYRETFQVKKDELDKLYGKSVIEGLQQAENKVAEAWSAFHTNINTSCNATEFFNSPGSPSDKLDLAGSFDSKDPNQKTDGKFLFPGTLRRAFSKETDNGKDLWLLEMKYYSAMLNQRQAWEGADPELKKLHAAVAKLEAERQEKVHSILLAFIPRQRRLSSNCASVHKPVLTRLVNLQMDQKVEEDVKLALRNHTRTLQEGGTAHRSRFINRSRRQDDIIGGFEAPTGFEVLDSPISSTTLSSMKIIERRVRTVTGYQGWQTALSITTVDGFVHLFDLPDGVDTSAAPEKAFYSLWPALPTSESIKEKKPAGRKLLAALMPEVSLFIPHCSTSFDLEPTKENEFEVIESTHVNFGRFGVPKTRQVLLRTRTAEEAEDFINTNLSIS